MSDKTRLKSVFVFECNQSYNGTSGHVQRVDGSDRHDKEGLVLRTLKGHSYPRCNISRVRMETGPEIETEKLSKGGPRET